MDEENDNVIADITSGKLSAVIMFAEDEAMKREAGPVIYPTLDETRVVVSFNKKAFNWRVKKMTESLMGRNPEMDYSTAERTSRQRLGAKMMQQASNAVDEYFQAHGLAHLGDSGDEV